MAEWLPIVDAPNDGTIVDLWRVNIEHGYGHRVADAWFDGGRWLMNDGDIETSVDGSSERFPSPDWTVTHFMLRPNGPNGETNYSQFG